MILVLLFRVFQEIREQINTRVSVNRAAVFLIGILAFLIYPNVWMSDGRPIYPIKYHLSVSNIESLEIARFRLVDKMERLDQS